MNSYIKTAPFVIRLPADTDALDQDQEWFEVESEGRRKRLRVHDYASLYELPGLYETLVYEVLRCRSPRRLTRLLATVLEDCAEGPGEQRVLEVGAGNGVVAEHLRAEGVPHIVGLDLIPEAAMAAERDRPGAYDDYVVADLDHLDPADRHRLVQRSFTCLVTVAALGFGDVPPTAFAAACNLIADGGWVAMTIKDTFLVPARGGGFGQMIGRLIDEKYLEVTAHHRYCHRVSVGGKKLHYVALIARKLRRIPDSVALASASPVTAFANGAGHASVLPGA